MEDHLKNVAVTPGFVVKHQVAKMVLGMAAGFFVGKVYDKAVVIPALEKIYEKTWK